ncbi:MAG: glycosyltransferase [Candidatus Bathyarchaeia archaeon]
MCALPLVDICVLVKNEAKSIGKCLDSLLANDYPNFRIIVCDGRSTDGTLEILQEYAKKHHNIVVCVQKSTGCGAARQELMEFVEADYVAWTDGGSIVDKNWLRELVVSLVNSDEKVAATGGLNYVISNGSSLAQCLGLLPVGIQPEEDATGAISLSGNNVCFKTKVLRENPWATFLNYGDDYEMALRLRQKGYKFIVVPNAKAYVRTQENFKDAKNWVKRKARGEVFIYAKSENASMSLKEFLHQAKMALIKRLTALTLLLLLLIMIAITPYKIPLTLVLVLFVALYLTYLFRRRLRRRQLGERIFWRTYLLLPLFEFILIMLYAFYLLKYSKSLALES